MSARSINTMAAAAAINPRAAKIVNFPRLKLPMKMSLYVEKRRDGARN